MKRVWEYHSAGSTASVGSKLKCLLLSIGGSLINFKWNRRDLYVFVVVVFGLIAICTPPGGGCLTYFRFVQLPLTHACVRSCSWHCIHIKCMGGPSRGTLSRRIGGVVSQPNLYVFNDTNYLMNFIQITFDNYHVLLIIDSPYRKDDEEEECMQHEFKGGLSCVT